MKTREFVMKTDEKNFEKNFKKGIDKSENACYNIQVAANEAAIWKHSSVGRASALQAEGHRFEPFCFHQRGVLTPTFKRSNR